MLGEANRDRSSERREATLREIVDTAWAIARQDGLAQVTLRGIAGRMGMRAPSLYSHVPSKNAIYDLMFEQAWTQCHELMAEVDRTCPPDLRGTLKRYARGFFDFCVDDLARYQLINQRTLPGFEPSPRAYAPAVAVMETLRARLAEHGVTAQEDVDLYVAIVSGLADSQLANDPGGERWSRLVERAMDMYVDGLGPEHAEKHPTHHHRGRNRRDD